MITNKTMTIIVRSDKTSLTQKLSAYFVGKHIVTKRFSDARRISTMLRFVLIDPMMLVLSVDKSRKMNTT